jgi:hypothetical protein
MYIKYLSFFVFVKVWQWKPYNSLVVCLRMDLLYPPSSHHLHQYRMQQQHHFTSIPAASVDSALNGSLTYGITLCFISWIALMLAG